VSILEILNRQARHNYFVDDVYECGIVLKGTEVKSIRDGKCNLRDSYALIRNGEVFLVNMFVSHYKEGNIFNQDETRSGKKNYDKRESIKQRDLQREVNKNIKYKY